MRNNILLIIKIITVINLCLAALSACVKPNYYQSNGVHYFEKPERELSGIIRIKDPNELNMLCDDGVVIDSMLFIAPASNQKKGNEVNSRLAVFRINPSTAVIQDSLIVSEKNSISRLCPVESSGNLFLAAIKWSQEIGHLFILKTNTNLSRYETFDYDVTGLTIQQIISRGKYIYLQILSEKQESYLIKVNTETMKVESSTLISPNPIKCYLYNGQVYILEKNSKGIKINQSDIDTPDKITSSKDFAVRIVSNLKENERRYTMYVDKDYAYLLYRKSFTLSEQGEGTFSIVQFNLRDNSFTTSDFKGAQFDLVQFANQLILFKSDYRQSYRNSINYLVPVLSQLSNDLSNETELVAYLPSEYNYAFKLVPVSENKVAMIGSYQFFTKDTKANIFTPFVAFFDPK